MQRIKLGMLTLMTALLAVYPLCAENDTDEGQPLPVNDKAMSVTTYFAILDQKAAEAEQQEETQEQPTQGEEEKAEKTEQDSGEQSEQADEQRETNAINPRYTSHNDSNSAFVGVSEFFEHVKLRDGSWWLVRPDDRWMLKEWIPGDIVVITQSDRHWWQFRADKYIYAIYNSRTRHMVEVEIKSAPPYDNYHRLWIENIYKGQGNAYLVLSDRTVWTLTENERMVWEHWNQGETVIIGINNSWWNWQTPNILINIHNTYVPVQTRCQQ